MSQRFLQLDSLRGLAAVSVVCHHFLLILPSFAGQQSTTDPVTQILKTTPLHIFWAGYEAVVLFFLLSGFVLSLAFFSKKTVSYPAFLIKRVFRIYPACYAAILVAILLDLSFSRHGIPGMSDWFNSIWVSPVTPGSLLNHALLLNYFGYGQYVPVLWTLVMELRLSLIFPILMWLMLRYDGRIVLLGGFLLSFGYYTVQQSVIKQLNPQLADYAYTFVFLCMFLTGALIARYRNDIIKKMHALLPLEKLLLFTGAVLLSTCRYWLLPQEDQTGTHSFFSDLGIITGTSLFLMLALSAKPSSFLFRKPFVFLGKISYSMYLSHAVILVALTYVLYGSVPIVVIWFISGILTIIVSYLSYTYIEQPGIRFGAGLARRITDQPRRITFGKKRPVVVKSLSHPLH